MIKMVRTNSENTGFIELVEQLDADLAIRDGADHSFYHQFNKTDALKHVIVLYENDKALGCGAMKQFSPEAMEIKRMYTIPEARGKGVASRVLEQLEIWANELGYRKCVLETGKKQPEAVSLYKKNGYNQIPNYGQYTGIENSLCFEKVIKILTK